MFKAGLVGGFTRTELDVISVHPGFQVTGFHCPGQHPENTGNLKLPALAAEALLEINDVLIFSRADTCAMGILSDALKHSRHVLMMDTGGLTPGAILELIKLQEEALTVVQTTHIERSNPVLHACLPLIAHPCLLEIKMMVPGSFDSYIERPDVKTLLRMLDTILFLSPLNIQKIQSVRYPVSFASTCLVSARLEFDNGSVANLLSCNMAETGSFKIDIYQKCNLLKIDMLKQELLSIEKLRESGKINTRLLEFNNRSNQIFYNELENFYHSLMRNNTSGKDLFDIYRMAELSRKITLKAGLPELV
jgi:hypothetical protein